MLQHKTPYTQKNLRFYLIIIRTNRIHTNNKTKQMTYMKILNVSVYERIQNRRKVTEVHFFLVIDELREQIKLSSSY